MSYYLGFRHGWLRIGRCMLCWHDPAYYPNFGRGVDIGRWRIKMQWTVRQALIFYLSTVTIAIVGAWVLALYDWRAGMALLTIVLLGHVWRWLKILLRNKP